MKKIITIYLVLQSYLGFGQLVQWAKTQQNIGGAQEAVADKSIVDPLGNVYCVGRFTGTVKLDNNTITSQGAKDIFISKIDPAGNYVWVKTFGGASNEETAGIDFCNAFNKIVIAGNFTGTASIDNNSVSSLSNSRDVFVCMLDLTGTVNMLTKFGGNGVDYATDVKFDNASNIYVAGGFKNDIQYGNTYLNQWGDYAFITKIGMDGSFYWLKNTGNYMTSADAFSVKNNSIQLVHHSDLNGTYGTSSIAIYDLNGTKNNEFIVANNVKFQSVATNINGDMFLAGYYKTQTSQIGAKTLYSNLSFPNSNQDQMQFICSINSTGNCSWASNTGSWCWNNPSSQLNLKIDYSNKLNLFGNFSGIANFGINGNVNSNGTDLYLNKYDLNGGILKSTIYNGTSLDYPCGITTDNYNNIYITGGTAGILTLGNTTITGNLYTGASMFISKLSSSLQTLNTSTSACIGSSFTVPFKVNEYYSQGNIFTAQLSDANGSFSNPINIGSLNDDYLLGNHTINAIIPSSALVGNNYKVRVIASNPSIISTESPNSFSIYNNPTISISGNATACSGNSLTLTANGGTSYLWSNGTTTDINTLNLNSSTTISVIGTDINGCSSSASKNITVNNSPNVTISSTANTVVTNTTVTLTASGATSYTWEPIVSTVNGIAYAFTLPFQQISASVTPRVNVTTTYTVSGTSNGCSSVATYTVNEAPTNSNVPYTKLKNTYCNDYLLPTAGSTFFCDPLTVTGVQNYQYEFKVISSQYPVSPDLTGMVFYATRSSWGTDMSLHNGGALLEMNGRKYAVRVRACVNGQWGNFVPTAPCTLITPNYVAPSTKLKDNYCGINLTTADQTFFCDAVGACGPVQDYQYEFTNLVNGIPSGSPITVNRGSWGTDLSLHSGGPYLEMNGKTYSVRVRAFVYGVWSNFGPACTLTTPAWVDPITKITDTYCGTTLATPSSTFYCEQVKYCGPVSNYNYEFTDLATNQVYYKTRGSYATTMSLHLAGQGLETYGRNYSVRVQALVDGVWSQWGNACIISTPASSARLSSNNKNETELNAIENKEIELSMYPNPTKDKLYLNSNKTVNSIEIYSLTGTLVLKPSTSTNEIDLSGLKNGVYFIRIEAEGNTKQQRIIKE